MGLGLSEIESGSVREKKKAPPPAVAMRGGGRARSFRPWSFGIEREEFENVQDGLGNRFDKEVVAQVSLTRLAESHIIRLTQSKKKQIHAQIPSPVHRICDLAHQPPNFQNFTKALQFIKMYIWSQTLSK